MTKWNYSRSQNIHFKIMNEINPSDLKDGAEEQVARKEIDEERRSLWQKIIAIDAGILGIVLPLISSQANQIILYPRLVYGAFFLVLLLGLFLVWIDNRRRLFLLDFTKITHQQVKEVLGGISDDKRREIFEVFKIEMHYGFGKHVESFPIIA